MDPEKDIINLMTDDSVLMRSSDLLEKSFDELRDSKVLDAFEIIGDSVSYLKGATAVYQYIFTRKVLSFAKGFSNTNSKKKAVFLKKLEKASYCRKVGFTILEILEKVFTNYKSEIIGILFAHHIDEKISFKQFELCSEMVINAYVGDLEYFKDNGFREEIDETGPEIEHLISLGFLERPMAAFGDRVMPSIYVKLTPSGYRILLAMNGLNRNEKDDKK